MIIKNVRLNTNDSYSTLSADCKIRKFGWDTLYFKIQADKADYICNDASSFAAALLIPCMRLNQKLVIHGNISEKLFCGMHKIMDEMLTWNINLHKIEIQADALTQDTGKPQGVGSYFTGGVDSFYTYLKHRRGDTNEPVIKTFIIVKGFDVKLSDTKLWNDTLSNIQKTAKEESIEVLPIETNIRSKIESMLLWDYVWFYPWDYIHGCCLAATGLLVRNHFKTIYIPSTFSVEEQLPWGSHLAIDKLWSTEKLTFVHDGSEITRPEKIYQLVAKSPLAQKHLKVCYVNTDGAFNCGKCDKCLRTMVTFYIAGVLNKMETFPHTFDLERIAKGRHHLGDGELILYGEQLNLDELRKRHLNPELQAALQKGINAAASHKATIIDKIKIRILKLKAKATYVDYAYLGGITSTLLNTFSGNQ